MIIDNTTFGNKLKGLFSQARENLQKKENGRTDFVFAKKEYGFYIDDKIKVKLGLGQFGVPAFVPWMGFLGPQQKPQKGIYPVILCYLKQHKIIITYGVSATKAPSQNWNSILNKDGNSPQTIGSYFKSNNTTVENPDYNKCYIYSVYSDVLNDSDIADIYDDVTTLLDVYRKTLGISPSIQNPMTFVSKNKSHSKPNNTQYDFSINTVINIIQSTGLIYSETLIKRLAYSLMAKPFVILSGLAGSGKTQLALAFAKCLSENIEEQVCPVSIGADWTNREPLLGYPNALKGDEYVMPESGVLQFLIRANEDPYKPYFLILDEMNLSVVERYFADFLSAMESGEPIKLWDKENGVPSEIALPKNVFIIGTINVDETTYMFSPKVLDRANVIEFKIAADEMDDYLGKKVNINLESAYSACANMAVDFVNKANSQVEKDEKNKDVLLSFFKELKKVNAEFGYRTVNEISRYLHFADGDLEDDAAIDTAILQKLLPKLHGSRKKLVPTLTALWDICLNDGKATKIEAEPEEINFQENFKYPESAEKIKRMYDAVIDNGFTSFAEA